MLKEIGDGLIKIPDVANLLTKIAVEPQLTKKENDLLFSKEFGIRDYMSFVRSKSAHPLKGRATAKSARHSILNDSQMEMSLANVSSNSVT
jgi:hypothetical protein